MLHGKALYGMVGNIGEHDKRRYGEENYEKKSRGNSRKECRKVFGQSPGSVASCDGAFRRVVPDRYGDACNLQCGGTDPYGELGSK